MIHAYRIWDMDNDKYLGMVFTTNETIAMKVANSKFPEIDALNVELFAIVKGIKDEPISLLSRSRC